VMYVLPFNNITTDVFFFPLLSNVGLSCRRKRPPRRNQDRLKYFGITFSVTDVIGDVKYAAIVKEFICPSLRRFTLDVTKSDPRPSFRRKFT